MTQLELFDRLASLVVSVSRPHPVRVAIDGVDGAGKTSLANGLARVVRERGRQVVRASIDGFHRPRSMRLRRGEFSPEGYYLDSFDYDALLTSVLLPLGSGGDRTYYQAVFDYRTDLPTKTRPRTAANDAVQLFDGVFLLRPELNDHWDFRIFIQVTFDEALQRVKDRDRNLFGSEVEVIERYRRRYIPGQRIYLETVQPEKLSEVIIDNNDVGNPKIHVRSLMEGNTP